MKKLSLTATFFITFIKSCLAQYPAWGTFTNSSLQDMLGKSNVSIHYTPTHEYKVRFDEILNKTSEHAFTAVYIVNGSSVMPEIDNDICVGIILLLSVEEFKTVYNYYNNALSLLKVTDGTWVSLVNRIRFSLKPLDDESVFSLYIKKI